jgi:exosome complex component RRP43
MFISADGNLFDAAWTATLAALRNTALPRAWWNPDLETVVCADSERPRRLALKGGPVAASFAVFEPGKMKGSKNEKETWVLADPDGFEEGLCKERVTVVVDREDNGFRVRRIEKSGGTVLGKEEMKNIVELAEIRWKEVRDAIDMIEKETI